MKLDEGKEEGKVEIDEENEQTRTHLAMVPANYVDYA